MVVQNIKCGIFLINAWYYYLRAIQLTCPASLWPEKNKAGN
jgi:hypothetical protein